MEQSQWIIFGKGLIIGSTMIVPGVSGGTMAIILGIYDRLIQAVGSFLKAPKNNLLFLLVFAAGAGLGLFLFSTPLSWLLEHYEAMTLYFFIGAVVGGIPLIGKKSGIQRVSLSVVGYMLLGALLVMLISVIPVNVSGAQASQGVSSWIPLALAGILSSVALILPGISFSHFLLILGLYDHLLEGIKTIEMGILLPLGAGVFVGILLFSKLLETFMQKYPKQTYLIILGFIVGSVAQIFPGVSLSVEMLYCIVTALLGFFLTYGRKAA